MLIGLGITLGAIVTSQAFADTPPPAPLPPLRLAVGDTADPIEVRPTALLERARAHAAHLEAVARWHHVRAVARYKQRVRERRAAARQQAAQAAQAATAFSTAMACIGLHEEGGHNSVAGYYGFVYPPSSYIDPGPAIAAQYGDDWLAVPQSAQLQLAAALQAAYGWSPWSTAGACGLS